MTTLGKTDYSSIIMEAQSKLYELEDLFNSNTPQTDSKGSSNFSGAKIGNLLNGTASNIQNLVEGNDTQKATAIKNILSDFMDLFSNIGTGEDSKARKKVKSNDKKIEENKKEAEETSKEISTKVQEILSNCENGATNIQNALEKIQELGGDQGAIAEAQAKLEAQLQIIEENKVILNAKDKDPNERKQALVAILNASKEINNLVTQVNEYNALISEQNKVVEENSQQLAELSQQSAETISNGVAQMKDSLVEAGILTKEEAEVAIDAAKQTAIGTAQQTAGEAMSSNAVTVAEGVKYTMSGADKLNAGSTLMNGSQQGLSKLNGSIGQMGQYLTHFTEFGNGLGTFLKGATELIGAYDNTVNSFVDSIGSWNGYAEAATALQTYNQQYSQTTLGEETNNSSTDNGAELDSYTIENADSKKMKFNEYTFEAKSTFGL